MAGLEGHEFGSKIKQGLDMGGPAFALNSSTSLELTFDDMEEIKAHPMANMILISMDQLLQTIVGKDKKQIMEYKPDFSSVEDKKDLDKHIAANEYCSEKKSQLELFEFIGEIVSDLNPDCEVNLKLGILGLMGAEYNIEGAGYGEMVNLMYRAFTCNL